ncbi:MAG: glycerol kinase GlpK [Roseiarcus sp.]
MTGHIVAIDQGTTSTRAIVFGPDAAPIASAQQEFRQIFPKPGWVEHDPEDIWRSTLATVREALSKASLAPSALAGVGIANQRETTLVWNRKTGRAIHNAIVWQDRRTAELCADLRSQGLERLVAERTGLLLDPYFSATKIAWMLDNVPGARSQAERGELAFGTVDSFLLWRLTNGETHATDATNASRTLLFNIGVGAWDDELLGLFGVPRSMLPEVRDCAAEFGVASSEHFGAALPIRGVAGDQQAALIGQACFRPGMAKSTFGTGAFVLLNTGATAIASKHKLLTTIAYQWKGERAFALEGSIFSAGATVQWLRDGLGIVANAAETGALAAAADAGQRVYFVPAFTGLGAPHWNSEARGAITGLTRGATRKEIARAALESVAYQTRDLIAAMRADEGERDGEEASPVIRVDGGMSASDWTMQFLADMLDAPVDRPSIVETTALGAAFLAGWQAGVYAGPEEFARSWRVERRFTPSMRRDERESRYLGWRDAVERDIAPSKA